MANQQDFWVFGYGSLLWKPGFEIAEKRLATLHGFSRSFCMASIHYRGTPEAPGLVLALEREREAVCNGVGFRVDAANAHVTLNYLRERELVSAAYIEQTHPIHFRDGSSATAICYVIDPTHVQYRGGLSLDQQAEIIATAHGSTGRNSEYLFNTVAHLDALEISDTDLSQLAAKVKKAIR